MLPPLRVVLLWRGEPIEDRVIRDQPQRSQWMKTLERIAIGKVKAPNEDKLTPKNHIVTIGARGDETFAVPPNPLGDGYALFTPSGSSYAVMLSAGMGGKICIDGTTIQISELVSARNGGGRAQPLGTSDWGVISLDPANEVAIFFQFLQGAPKVPPALDWMDAFFGQGLAFAGIVTLALLGIAFWIWDREDQLDVDPPPSAAIAKLLLDKPPEPEPEEKKEKAKKVREDDASKKAAGKEGKIGDRDAKPVKTVIPKGPRDQIAAKVSNLGLLGMLKQNKQNTALKSLLSDNPNADITTAMAGVKGAQLVVGRGSGGMGLKGEGTGGGGKGPGQLMGVGDLAVGGGGKGRVNTGTGGGHVGKEKKVEVTNGPVDVGGGLSKEQILKVVQSHAAAIQFCYEKELQRFPHLAGKVVVDWKVDLDGRVQMSKIGSTTLNNPGAESCMVRQIRAWQFPKPNGVVCNVSFPFFFKGQ